ncbi:SCO6880 family protein [Brevibacterium sp. SIMBA_078]|uniref:SCO6880 family protein n=1 Tax=Brevibacterium sp. SIMBA_078 TaxID=3085816 RepID=UPI00397E61C4
MSQQTVQTSEWDGARFGREQGTGVAFGLGMGQIIFIGAGLAVALIVVFVFNSAFPVNLLPAGGVLAVTLAIGVPRIQGKSLLEWASVVRFMVRRRRRGQNEFVPPTSGVAVEHTDTGWVTTPHLDVVDGPVKRSDDTARDKKGRITVPKATRLVLPGEFAELLMYQLPGGAAFIYDPVAKQAIIIAEIDTHKAFELEEFEGQEDRLRVWAEIEATLSGIEGVAWVQMSDQTTMVSGQAVLDYYESRVNESDYRVDPVTGEHLRNAGQELNPWLHQGLVEMLASVEGRPVHTRWLSVVLNRDQLTKRIQGAGRGIRGFMEVALSVMNTVAEALPESGTEVARWHTPTSAAALIRTAFDPASSVEVTARGEAGVAVGAAGPMYTKTNLGTFESDGAVHQTLKISEFPRQQAKLGFLADIVFAGDFRHTVSMYMKPRNVRKALKKNERDRSTWLTNDTVREKVGKMNTLKNDRQREDLEQEEMEMTSGHAALSMAVYVTVSAMSEPELEAQLSQLRNRVARANCELRPLFGQQDSAFVAAATPLGRLKL